MMHQTAAHFILQHTKIKLFVYLVDCHFFLRIFKVKNWIWSQQKYQMSYRFKKQGFDHVYQLKNKSYIWYYDELETKKLLRHSWTTKQKFTREKKHLRID